MEAGDGMMRKVVSLLPRTFFTLGRSKSCGGRWRNESRCMYSVKPSPVDISRHRIAGTRGGGGL